MRKVNWWRKLIDKEFMDLYGLWSTIIYELIVNPKWTSFAKQDEFHLLLISTWWLTAFEYLFNLSRTGWIQKCRHACDVASDLWHVSPGSVLAEYLDCTWRTVCLVGYYWLPHSYVWYLNIWKQLKYLQEHQRKWFKFKDDAIKCSFIIKRLHLSCNFQVIFTFVQIFTNI